MLDFTQARTTMVDTQVRPSDVTRYPVIAAMLDVPRELFVPPGRRDVAYAGQNLPLAPAGGAAAAAAGARVLLEPRTLAKMIDALDPQPGSLALDVGCGTGYAAALLGRIAGGVVALEEPGELARAAGSALAAAGAERVALVEGPLAEGWPAQAPYDTILVSGGAVEVLPEALLAQLAEGGRIAALFVEGGLGTVRLGVATAGRVGWRDQFNAHAPLLAGFARPRRFTL